MARGALVLDPVETSRAALVTRTTRLVSFASQPSSPVSPQPTDLSDSTIFQSNFKSQIPQVILHKDSLEYGEP